MNRRLIAALLLASACGRSEAPARTPSSVENRAAASAVEPACVDEAPDCFPRDLTLVDTTGRAHRSADLAGKVIVLTFFATWNKPAAADITTFNKAIADHAARGVVILGILVEDIADADLQQFIIDHAITYPVVRHDSALARHFRAPSAMPLTFVYDRRGNRQTDQLGRFDPANLAALLEELLAE